jgi:hypothetical protein
MKSRRVILLFDKFGSRKPLRRSDQAAADRAMAMAEVENVAVDPEAGSLALAATAYQDPLDPS